MIRISRLLMVLLPAASCLAAGLAVSSIARTSQTTDKTELPLVKTAPAVVAGAGIVEPPGGEIAVAAPVSGTVGAVMVKPGQRVAKGAILFRLDDGIATAVVTQRREDLRAAEFKLAQAAGRAGQLRAEVAAQKAAADAAQAERDEAREDLTIASRLVDKVVSPREVLRRQNRLRVAESNLASALARASAAEAELALIDPTRQGPSYLGDQQAVKQARAALALAEREAGRLIIHSPNDGTVLAVNVQPGEFAQAGSQTPPVSIGNLAPLHVRVTIDEADMPRLDLAGRAIANLPGENGRDIALTLVRAEPTLVPKRNLVGEPGEKVDTRVLELVYAVVGSPVTLRPGQSLDVHIEATEPARKANGTT